MGAINIAMAIKLVGTNEDHRAARESLHGCVRLVDESDTSNNCQSLHVIINFTLKDPGSIKQGLQCQDSCRDQNCLDLESDFSTSENNNLLPE